MDSIRSLVKSIKAIGQPDSRFLDLYIPALLGYFFASSFRPDTDYEIKIGINSLKSGIFSFLSIAYLIIVYAIVFSSFWLLGYPLGFNFSDYLVLAFLAVILFLPFYIFQFTGHFLRESYGILQSFGKSVSIVRQRPGDSLIFFLMRFVVVLGILASIILGGEMLIWEFKGMLNARAAYFIWISLFPPLTYSLYSHWGRTYAACFIDNLQGENKNYPSSELSLPNPNPIFLILTGIILSLLGLIAYSIAFPDIWPLLLGIILLISGIISGIIGKFKS